MHLNLNSIFIMQVLLIYTTYLCTMLLLWGKNKNKKGNKKTISSILDTSGHIYQDTIRVISLILHNLCGHVSFNVDTHINIYVYIF